MNITGINHLALVCRDMAETLRFYSGILGMKLIKTVALSDGGQHFFLDCGGGSSLAFFWWPDVTEGAPGIASVRKFPHDAKTAVGSMNHLAFSVPEDELDAHLAALTAAGVPVFPAVINHDDSTVGVASERHPGVFVRSVYFTDPNGIMLEVAAFTREFTDADVRHEAATRSATV